ncbi:sulfatase [uncultured Draconibacterium sp.]|uniref:sulfatase family protein n=1 Tax=uncultured Draconibacterium sp. TaxID=1573823 RepID=UPI00326158FD
MTAKNLGFMLMLILAFSSCKKQEQTTKPNIVYILTDQWRAQALGYAGDPNVKTPNLDKFASEAVNFVNAVSVCPVCTPHRAALLTGRYPTSTGMFFNDLYLPAEELCMAEIFKAEGYNTAYLGKWHLDGHGRHNNVEPERRQGFDYWKALECSHDYNNMPYYDNANPEMKYWDGYSPYALAEDANNYMTLHTEDENPFLLFVSIATPHFPHGSAPQEYKDLYPKDEIKLSPNVAEEFKEQARVELQGYYGHCTATDKAIGSILDKIKELNLAENTIVVFTSDHGEMMGSHGVKPLAKQVAWDESIKVPFLISYPSIDENKGAVVNAPINTPDILPSLLSLANIEIPGSIEGEDLSELILTPDSNTDRTALVMNPCPFTRESVYPEYRAIRTKQFTYARTPEGANKLFDNLKDPYQLSNLVDKPEFEELQKDLDAKLNAELQKISDEFHPREYYVKKWNYTLDEEKKCINYWDFEKGTGMVQSPKLNK